MRCVLSLQQTRQAKQKLILLSKWMLSMNPSIIPMCFFFVVLFLPFRVNQFQQKTNPSAPSGEWAPRLEDSLQILEFDVEVGCADGYYGDAPKVSRKKTGRFWKINLRW